MVSKWMKQRDENLQQLDELKARLGIDGPDSPEAAVARVWAMPQAADPFQALLDASSSPLSGRFADNSIKACVCPGPPWRRSG